MIITNKLLRSVGWALVLLSLICTLKKSSYTYLQRAASVVSAISETIEGMPVRPKNLPKQSFPACEEEKEYEVARDEFFASLTPEILPHPFPVDTFPIEIITREQCLELTSFGEEKNMQNSDTASVLFHLQVSKDFDMVERTVKRLLFEDHHGFVIHVTTDVSEEYIDLLVGFSEEYSESPICIIRGGYVKSLTSTDIRVLFSSMRWLKTFSIYWDFFVSLSGADYSMMDGPTLNKELVSEGPLSWKHNSEGYEKKDLMESTNKKRLLSYGLSCEEKIDLNSETRGGRTFWLQKIVPEITIGNSSPYSSGGILHRSMVDFLIDDDRARAAYMYFRQFPVGGFEHYWSSLYTLPELEPLLLTRDSAAMFWHQSRDIDGMQNSFITMAMWEPNIKPAIDAHTPFIRKFDSQIDSFLLDRIDQYSAQVFSGSSNI